MKLKEVMLNIVKAVGRTDIENQLDKIKSPIDIPDLGYIYSVLNEELRKQGEENEYLETETIKTIDKQIHNAFMEFEVFKVVSVKLNGEDVKFKQENGYIVLDKDGEYEVTYRTYPEVKKLDLNEEYSDKATMLIFNAIINTVAKYKDEFKEI